MKKLHGLVLRSYLGPFLMSFAVILFILVVQFMALYMDKIAGKGVGGDVLIQLFGYAAGRLAVTAMPVAILAGALMTFGGMGEHYELAAIKSCGISLFRLMRPTIILALFLTGLSLWASYSWIPRANLKFFSLVYDISRKKPEVALQPGHFYSDIDNYVIRVSDKDKESGMLYEVMIYDHSENRGNIKVILADSGRTQMYENGNILKMTLYHGSRHEEFRPEAGQPNKFPLGKTYFDSLYYTFNLRGFDLNRTDESQFRHQIIMPMETLYGAIDSLLLLRESRKVKYIDQLSRHNRIDTHFLSYNFYPEDTNSYLRAFDLEGMRTWECLPAEYPGSLLENTKVNLRSIKSYLKYMTDERDEDEKMLRRYQYELYNRYAMPVNCLLFMLMGVSLGAIIRKGGLGMPSLISIILFMAFYIAITQGKKMSKQGIMEPLFGAWLPVIIFTPIAIYITIQATTDARLLDESAWGMLRDRIRLGYLMLLEKTGLLEAPKEESAPAEEIS